MSHRPAQTLLEMVIASGIIVVSVISAITLIISTITAGAVSQQRIEAANLAREGIEVIRHIRDSNALRIERNIFDQNGQLFTWNENPACTACGILDPNKRLSGSFRVFFVTPGSLAAPLDGWQAERCDSCSGSFYDVYYDSSLNVFTQKNCGAACTPTRYHRQVTISQFNEATTFGSIPWLNVTSTVTWVDRTGNRTLVAEERLYDWR